jgi:hypothetical protein
MAKEPREQHVGDLELLVAEDGRYNEKDARVAHVSSFQPLERRRSSVTDAGESSKAQAPPQEKHGVVYRTLQVDDYDYMVTRYRSPSEDVDVPATHHTRRQGKRRQAYKVLNEDGYFVTRYRSASEDDEVPVIVKPRRQEKYSVKDEEGYLVTRYRSVSGDDSDDSDYGLREAGKSPLYTRHSDLVNEANADIPAIEPPERRWSSERTVRVDIDATAARKVTPEDIEDGDYKGRFIPRKPVL